MLPSLSFPGSDLSVAHPGIPGQDRVCPPHVGSGEDGAEEIAQGMELVGEQLGQLLLLDVGAGLPDLLEHADLELVSAGVGVEN